MVSFRLSPNFFTVDAGHKAILFNKFSGLKEATYREGWHIKTPWLERAIIYNVRAMPTTIESKTGSMDLQQVKIALSVLYRPDQNKLQTIYRNLGKDYDQRVLPSIVNEVLKSVVAQYNSQTLLSQREQVSQKIKINMTERLRDFNIVLDDVSIVSLTYGTEFTKAIEEKQIAQQKAERAKFLVDKAI